MEIPLLRDIVIILGLSVLIVLLFYRFKLPSILGLLITGVLVGPHGMNLIHSHEGVELLAEIGIIFLLFVIGVEFSLKGLSSIKGIVIGGGMMQVFGTIIVVTSVAYSFGISLASAVFLGFLFSMSSTAIVLKMMHELGEITSPHGRVSVAILIFQDIIVVPMMLLVPILAGASENPVESLIILAVKVLVTVVAVILLARYLVPVLFKQIVRTKSRELFILSVVVLCFATAWLTSLSGLSLALGAFFAGLIISESDYSHQAAANILPFREIFISIFFVSIGMLLDISFFLDNIILIVIISIAVMLLKMFVIGLSVYLLRFSPTTVIMTSLSLFQVGEFAFLLSAVGMSYKLLSVENYQLFLAVSIISMGITPFIINLSPKITSFLQHRLLPSNVRTRLRSLAMIKAESSKKERETFNDHLVIVGYGVNGENLAKAARYAGISYVIVELDPNIFEKAKANNEPVVYGDAKEETILKHINIQNARIVVIAISAPEATRQIVRMIRVFTETTHVIVRTRYLREVDEILKLGADEVIPEEFETSVEIFIHVLKNYLVPNGEIQNFVNEIRSGNYEKLRNYSAGFKDLPNAHLSMPGMEISTIKVLRGGNSIVGKTIMESGLRSNYGVTVLAIKRGEKYLTEIGPEDEIELNDILYIFGRPSSITAINKFLTL